MLALVALVPGCGGCVPSEEPRSTEPSSEPPPAPKPAFSQIAIPRHTPLIVEGIRHATLKDGSAEHGED
jgi:hypothetical protein